MGLSWHPVLWHAQTMNTGTHHLVQHSAERDQFLDSYAENLTLAMDLLESMATELANVGDYQASSFFSGVSRTISAFAATHYPLTRLIRPSEIE